MFLFSLQATEAILEHSGTFMGGGTAGGVFL